jgi:hypothetical protein
MKQILLTRLEAEWLLKKTLDRKSEVLCDDNRPEYYDRELIAFFDSIISKLCASIEIL